MAHYWLYTTIFPAIWFSSLQTHSSFSLQLLLLWGAWIRKRVPADGVAEADNSCILGIGIGENREAVSPLVEWMQKGDGGWLAQVAFFVEGEVANALLHLGIGGEVAEGEMEGFGRFHQIPMERIL